MKRITVKQIVRALEKGYDEHDRRGDGGRASKVDLEVKVGIEKGVEVTFYAINTRYINAQIVLDNNIVATWEPAWKYVELLGSVIEDWLMGYLDTDVCRVEASVTRAHYPDHEDTEDIDADDGQVTVIVVKAVDYMS